MKSYPVKIMNISDLIRFNRFVKQNHIKGTVVQNKYKTGAGNVLGLMIVLPLDSAELVVEKCDENLAGNFTAILQHA